MSSKRRSRELAIETLGILAERFPAAFLLEGHRRPLKIGIDRDLAVAAPDLAGGAIKQALRLYVGAPQYQRALADGAKRIDLAGAPAGAVTAAEGAKANAARERQDATGQRPSPKTKSAMAAATRATPLKPTAVNQAATASGRPRLTLASLREAAQRRKGEQA